MSTTVDQRINSLRAQMAEQGISAVILPSNDPHQSEYVSDYWKVREHFSGFTGSAGTFVVTQEVAALWTDSRYFLQVEDECADSSVELFKQSIPHAPEHVEWVCDQLPENSTIGYDFRLLSLSQETHLRSSCAAKSISLKDIGSLIEMVWSDRPAEPNAPIVDHAVTYSGESREDKLNALRSSMVAQQVDYSFYSRLDDICWILNIRSTDVDFTPLVVSYLLIDQNTARLFVGNDRITGDLANDLNEANVIVESYDTVFNALSELPASSSMLTDASSLNFSCKNAFSGTLQFSSSEAQVKKSIKNEIEISGSKLAMVKDGVSLTRFFIWLEHYLQHNTISEYDLGKKLESFRKAQPDYKGESFAAIVGYKGNGAIIHYTAPKEGSSIISNEGMLLLDSGAQYLHGTTDITRTIWLGGRPSEEQKKAFTLVLKGYIELETCVFPEGTTGVQLDPLARKHLWQHGLTYGHGTGHGIGHYSMVHEPRQGFASSNTTSRGSDAHQANQLTSIEPGYYKTDAFGIRTENVVLSKVVRTEGSLKFLGFEPITLCPIDTQLIDWNLFNSNELDWLNTYHDKVYTSLKDELNETEELWLRNKCQAIQH